MVKLNVTTIVRARLRYEIILLPRFLMIKLLVIILLIKFGRKVILIIRLGRSNVIFFMGKAYV